MLTAEKIVSNWETHRKIVDVYISDRKKAIFTMLDDLEEEYTIAPASTKEWHHNSFPGGYVDHVNRVVELALKQKKTYTALGGICNFTDEELVFSALFHDLGKIGSKDNPTYIPQKNKWRQENLKENYTYNPDTNFMLIQDRSLYMLQQYSIKVSENEYIAIRVHDGMFDRANEAYYIGNVESSAFKTNLPYILHTADYLASKIEKDILLKSKEK